MKGTPSVDEKIISICGFKKQCMWAWLAYLNTVYVGVASLSEYSDKCLDSIKGGELAQLLRYYQFFERLRSMEPVNKLTVYNSGKYAYHIP
jgi:hypothetical protein